MPGYGSNEFPPILDNHDRNDDGLREQNNHGRFARSATISPTEVQDELYAEAGFVERFGPETGRPHVDTLKDSDYANMKGLRFEAADGEWRVAFAFDPKRRAVLLIAGDKIFAAAKSGDWDAARRCQSDANQVIEVLAARPFFAALRAVLKHEGFDCGPLLSGERLESEGTEAKIIASLQQRIPAGLLPLLVP